MYSSGNFLKAVEHYEAFYNLTVGRTWKDDGGRNLNSLSCEHLWRIYTLLADKMLANNEHQEAIRTLTKALKMAEEGEKEITFLHCLSLICKTGFSPKNKEKNRRKKITKCLMIIFNEIQNNAIDAFLSLVKRKYLLVNKQGSSHYYF